MYPLTYIEMQLGGVAFMVEAVVSDRLTITVPQLV